MEKVASVKDIKSDTAQRTMKRIDLGSGQSKLTINVRKDRGNMWFTDGGTVKTKKSSNYGKTRWWPMGTYEFGSSTYQPFPYRMNPNNIWTEANTMFQYGLARMSEETRKSLAARGITQKSWVEMLESIPGQTLDNTAPKSARINAATLKAVSRAGPRRQGYAVDSNSGLFYELSCYNTSSIAVKHKGIEKIQAAIRIREAAFRQAAKHGVFSDAKAIAQRYPGIIATEV
jgi:hypothetical protein